MMNDGQKDLLERLDFPSYTSDDCQVMAEAAIEIRYLAERIEILERQLDQKE